MDKTNFIKNKYIYLTILIFILLNVFPATIVTCDKKQDICQCTQIPNVFKNSNKSVYRNSNQYRLKQIKISNIKNAVLYKQISRKKKYKYGYSIGINLKEQQRMVFNWGEEGDYIIPNYDISKATTQRFVNKLNNFIENENDDYFKDIHINPLSIVLVVIVIFAAML